MRYLTRLLILLLALLGVASALPTIRATHPPDLPIAQAFTDVLPPELLERLHKDALEVTTWERSQPALLNNKYRTRWYDLATPPSTSIELAIQYLKKFANPPENVIGAEWWTQYVPAGPKGTIIWHVDKDESVASNKYYLSHPSLGSILYLTSTGGPTAITNQWSPEGNGYFPEIPDFGILSFPEVNKYTIFHGELLHGVLPGKYGDEGYRLTFLVNWWTYKPEEPNCSLFPYEKNPSIPRYTQAEMQKWQASFTLNYDHYRLQETNVAAPKREPHSEFVSYLGNASDPQSISPVRAPGPLIESKERVESVLTDYSGKMNNPQAEQLPVSTYIYRYSLPGGKTGTLRIPKDWFSGQSVWMVWNTSHAESLQNQRQNERTALQQRLQHIKKSRTSVSPSSDIHTNSNVMDGTGSTDFEHLRQARAARDAELLLKTEL